MEPDDKSKFQITDETNTKANQSLVKKEMVEPEPIQVFVKGIYLTKERTKWMEVHHDVKYPRTVKMMKVAGYTAYREKYQEVHFDLKRWDELYAQKQIIENYLNTDQSFLPVKKVKLSGNLKIVFKDETIGKFVTFSQSRNSVSMKGPTFSYMMKYNEWVQECLGD
ncbi:uncharacterized protein LOC117180277 isoform X2 [Belonocnema kinseyi]|nr:uncharacterized protein LOC117180277 isoform X2 [Belonocnema kinseyi]